MCLGTSVIVAPTADAHAFWSKVPGAGVYTNGYYTYPCASPPAISISFGGSEWPISAANLNMGALAKGSPRCVGTIIGQDVGLSESRSLLHQCRAHIDCRRLDPWRLIHEKCIYYIRLCKQPGGLRDAYIESLSNTVQLYIITFWHSI